MSRLRVKGWPFPIVESLGCLGVVGEQDMPSWLERAVEIDEKFLNVRCQDRVRQVVRSEIDAMQHVNSRCHVVSFGA